MTDDVTMVECKYEDDCSPDDEDKRAGGNVLGLFVCAGPRRNGNHPRVVWFRAREDATVVTTDPSFTGVVTSGFMIEMATG